MRRKDERLATRLRERGWMVLRPCDAHGVHPHGHDPLPILAGMPTCLDCQMCYPPVPAEWSCDPCIPVCADPAVHAEGGHDV